jgi:hypothetical protein
VIYRYYKLADDSVSYVVWARETPFCLAPEKLPWTREKLEDEAMEGVVLIPVMM